MKDSVHGAGFKLPLVVIFTLDLFGDLHFTA